MIATLSRNIYDSERDNNGWLPCSLAQLAVAPYLFDTASNGSARCRARETSALPRRLGHFIFKAQADVSENAIAKYNTVHYLYPGAPQKEIS